MRVIDEVMEVSPREQELVSAYRLGRHFNGGHFAGGLGKFSADPELDEAFNEGLEDAAAFRNN